MITSPKMRTLSALKVYDSKKEYFLYQLDDNNIVTDYVLTNDLSRYLNKYNKNYKLVSDLRKIIDSQLYI